MSKLNWSYSDFRDSITMPPVVNTFKGEGHWGMANPERMGCAILLMKAMNAKSYMEIGVNMGHSLHYILQSVPTVKEVLAFDLCDKSTKPAWEEIKQRYSNRVKLDLICGDTLNTLNKNLKNRKFDVIHIDGGHEFKYCYNDIIKSKKFATPETLVIIDDYGKQTKDVWTHPHVNRAVHKAIDEGIIEYIAPGVCAKGSVFVKYKFTS